MALSINPSALRADLIPLEDDTFSLGTPTFRLKNIYAFEITLYNRIGFETDLDISSNTADGADALAATYSGGGDADRTRGSFLSLHGNEHVSRGGELELATGNVSTSHLTLNVGLAGADLRIQNNGTDKIKFSGAQRIMDFVGTMTNGSADPTTDAPADWIEVKIGGTTRHIPVY